MTLSTEKGEVVSSHGVVTGGQVGGEGKGVLGTFLTELSQHRHWARDVSAVPI